MSDASFDTLAAARDMERAGMDRKTSEAVASHMRAAAKAGHEALATKTDLAALEARLTWRIVGLVVAANALLVAAVKLVP